MKRLRSRELGGGARGNHLVLDDTREMLQAQLKSDHQCSQLSLGHIHGVNNMVEVGEKVQFFTSSPVLFHGNLETLPAKSVS